MKIILRSLMAKTALAALLAGISVSAQTMELGDKQVNRAKVESVSARLRLPDGELLHMGMEPCVEGSRFKGLSIIGTSDFGIKVIAAGLSALYGYEWGEKATKAWLTKADPDDPRLPTMLVIMEPQQATESTSAKISHAADPVILLQRCGGLGDDHSPQ